jgi:hypothetical protein
MSMLKLRRAAASGVHAGGRQGEIEGAAEFGNQWLEAPAFRRLEAIESREHLRVHLFGVGQEAGSVGGTRLYQIDQAEADFDIGFHQLDANPVVRGSSVTARQTWPAFLSDPRY